jgi:DNA-binding transcriptional LysR family regulator
MQDNINASDLTVVLSLVRTGTLAAAGAQLGVDSSTVFRSIQRIENSLRQRLFERSRTGYRPTDLSLQLAQHAERIETEIEAARMAAHQDAGDVSGVVRISTTDSLLNGLVLPALASLGAAHSGLQFELNASNELVSLTKRDADIAVRATNKPPQHVVGKHVGAIRSAIFTARVRGQRKLPDPAMCAWIAPDDALPNHPSVVGRKRRFPRLMPQYRVNSILSVAEGIVAGLAVGILPLFLARDRKDLIALSEPLPDCETQLWLLTHQESRHLRRIATVATHLAQEIRLE